ncbi:hypothetical protein WJX72_003292 [[Myrmecia] bisecta]|uniref:TLC domain-containing protein n=1 Tax=[Myrmecia] bisecta TaxID=41462 RepID=A0AAW1PZT9_9CHLO
MDRFSLDDITRNFDEYTRTFRGFSLLDDDRLVWLGTGLASALSCHACYTLGSSRLSAHLSQAYGQLSTKDKKDWNSRYSSTFHAVVITVLATYIICCTDAFDESPGNKRQAIPLMFRSTRLTQAALGTSLGYFIMDLYIVAVHYPEMGGPEMLLHHTAALLSVLASACYGQAHLYTLILLGTEVTTPFINMRWVLDRVGWRQTRAYIANGVCLFVTWFLGRVLMFVWFFWHIYQHRAQLKLLNWPPMILITTVPPLLYALNLFWFGKICNGLRKLLQSRKHKVPMDEKADRSEQQILASLIPTISSATANLIPQAKAVAAAAVSSPQRRGTSAKLQNGRKHAE